MYKQLLFVDLNVYMLEIALNEFLLYISSIYFDKQLFGIIIKLIDLYVYIYIYLKSFE